MHGPYPVNVRFGFHFRFDGLQTVGQLHTSLYKVYPGHEVIGVENLFHMRTDVGSQHREYSHDFLPLLALQFSDAVVGLDNLCRFDEDSLARRTLIMHDPLDFTFQSRCHRYHQSPVA